MSEHGHEQEHSEASGQQAGGQWDDYNARPQPESPLPKIGALWLALLAVVLGGLMYVLYDASQKIARRRPPLPAAAEKRSR